MAVRPISRVLTRRGALRVPEVTAYFWLIKALSTAMGESTSDWSVHADRPSDRGAARILRVVVAALSLQFWVRRYIAWTYWLAVCAVGVFGTMCADVLRVGFGVLYGVSTALYAVLLAAVFFAWDRTEHTLSFHEIDTFRREIFFWAAIGCDVRDGDRARGPDRHDVRSWVLRIDDRVRRGNRDPSDRIPMAQVERELLLLVCLRGDTASLALRWRTGWGSPRPLEA